MTFLQKMFGAISPKYKADLVLKEQEKLFKAIINALPDYLSDIKKQPVENKFWGFKKWSLHPDFKYVEITYPGENYIKFKKRGENSKISGLKIFSKRNNKFEEIEIVLWDNLLWAIKIHNSNYEADEFDLSSIKNINLSQNHFEFPARKVDLFYDQLDNEIKQRLDYNNVFDTDFDGKTYYEFYDLEDGNYLAVDENLDVYSFVYAADPVIAKMKISFIDLLKEISNNQFNKELHLDERYKS